MAEHNMACRSLAAALMAEHNVACRSQAGTWINKTGTLSTALLFPFLRGFFSPSLPVVLNEQCFGLEGFSLGLLRCFFFFFTPFSVFFYFSLPRSRRVDM